jgi:hypothetical protein
VICGPAELDARTRAKKTIVKGLLLGLLLVGVSSVIHATSMVLIGEWLIKRLQEIKGHLSPRICVVLLTSVFAIIVLLHLAEGTLWAIAYYCLGLFNDLVTSLDFSLGSYTTNRVPGIQLPDAWKLLGQLESIAGLLLVGLSTAFLFLLIHKMFDIRHLARGKDS